MHMTMLCSTEIYQYTQTGLIIIYVTLVDTSKSTDLHEI